MKKLFVLLAFVFFGFTAQAGLKLQMQGNAYQPGGLKPLVGLSYYQNVSRFMAVSSWVGYGNVPLDEAMSDESVNWAVAKAQLDIFLRGNWTFSPGFQYKSEGFGDREVHYPYLRLDYKIF